MRIAVDAFGGDNAPAAVVEGCIDALKKYPDMSVTLCGDEKRIKAELEKYRYDVARVDILHAPEIISCDEQPTFAIRKKKDSSLVKAMELVRDKKADCVVSAGSTGAVLAGATFIIKRIEGVKRPAIGVVFPAEKGCVLIMDCGANVDCKPSYLQQFAVMASAYMHDIMGVDNPRVGLLNNGAEAEKGCALTKEAYALLEADQRLNFVSNVEAREITHDQADVIVCDGFVGNVILKFMEGVAGTLMGIIKKELLSDTRSKVGALLAKPAFGRVKKTMDYSEVGGAPLLGVRGNVVKAHGSSNGHALACAIGQAVQMIHGGVVEKIEALLPREEQQSAQ